MIFSPSKTHLIGGIAALLLVSGLFVLSGSGQAPTGNAASGETQVGMTASDVPVTTINGDEVQVSDYRGEKVMLWFFATWCSSCKAGAQALQANNDQLQNVNVIAVKTYGNAGYRGPSTQTFAQQAAPQLLRADNWVWGDASKEATQIFNPQNRPDIYYLIDEDGTIQVKSDAPAATIGQIKEFAQG